VTGFDMHGEPIRLEGTGRLARCLQHEYDHLQGMVYVDRLTAKERKSILKAAGLPKD
jgi:peptide deformylase